MIKSNSKIELLAPAGSPESLLAAVASGADAVYLGLDRFSARTSAVNFTEGNLREYIQHCHIHGVKTYLTLNTILYNDELQDAYETALFAYNNGIDAVILQDMGLASILRKMIPKLELHASTQLSINSRPGVEYLNTNGFSRVILAREMNLAAIKDASSTNVKTEVFVHGARCYSYSGQCLMSSMLGGRSGNRGSCAQPCRLPYVLLSDNNSILMQGHLLSLKDTSYIDSLTELKNAGVSALKIEGRMKTPEYVAAITSIYRKYLDFESDYKVLKEDSDDILKAFNREGFSKGALSESMGKNEFSRKSVSNSGFPVGKVVKINDKGSFVAFSTDIDKSDGLKIGQDGCFAGRDMSCSKPEFVPLQGNLNDIVYRTKDFAFNKKYKPSKILDEPVKVPVSAYASVLLNELLYFSVNDSEGNMVKAYSNSPVQSALSGGTSCERIRDQFLKTGSTPYEITDFKFKCDENIYIKISDINDLRRDVFDKLTAKRAGTIKDIRSGTIEISTPGSKENSILKTSICFYNIPDGLDFSKLKTDRIYIDYLNFKGNLLSISVKCRENNIGFYILIPYSCTKIPAVECDGYLVENHGMLNSLPINKVVLGTGFNITNSFAAAAYGNIDSFSLSLEMTNERVKSFANTTNKPAEIIVYGKPQVMESQYCPARDICSGDLCLRKNLILKDRKDEKWDILFDPEVHSVRIFNPHRLMLTESVPFIKESGVNRFRINIMDETADEVYEIIRSVNSGKRPALNPDYKFTRGHY